MARVSPAVLFLKGRALQPAHIITLIHCHPFIASPHPRHPPSRPPAGEPPHRSKGRWAPGPRRVRAGSPSTPPDSCLAFYALKYILLIRAAASKMRATSILVLAMAAALLAQSGELGPGCAASPALSACSIGKWRRRRTARGCAAGASGAGPGTPSSTHIPGPSTPSRIRSRGRSQQQCACRGAACICSRLQAGFLWRICRPA